jgi:hypothetical protein
LCYKSNRKVFVEGGEEFYGDKFRVERMFAYVRIPIADLEQVELGSFRRATDLSLAGHEEVVQDIGSRTLDAEQVAILQEYKAREAEEASEKQEDEKEGEEVNEPQVKEEPCWRAES